MTKKKHRATIGSLSHGTMRDEDLIPCFLNHIQYLDPKRITALRKDKGWEIITYILKRHGSIEDKLPPEGEWGDYTSELFDILNEYAPPYCSFGSSEGDGSDYGFWTLPWHEIKEQTDAPIVSDSSELPKGHTGEWFQVSDHGNVTLYVRNSKKQDKEIWGIV